MDTYQQILNIVEFLPDATFVINRDKKVLYWNRAIEEMTGMPKENIIGKGDYIYGVAFYGKPVPLLIDFIFSDNKDIEKKFDFIERKGETLFAELFVQSVYKGKGAYLWMKASPLYDNDGNLVGAIESIRDITKHKREEEEIRQYRNHLEELVIKLRAANEHLQKEIIERKQIEEALRESEERYRQLVELSPDAIFLHSKDRLEFLNEAAAKLIGAESPEEAIGMPAIDLIEPDYREVVGEKWRLVLEEGKTVPLREEKLIQFDGTVIDIEVMTAPLTFQGEPKILAVVRDITERKRVEKALKESHDRFLTVLDSLDTGVYVIDMETHEILFTNQCTREQIGAVEGKICWQTIQNGQSGPCDFCTNNKLLTPEGEPTGLYVWEFQNTRNGKWVECRDRAIRWIDGRMVRLEIATDITERRRARELIEAERKKLFTALQITEERYQQIVETANEGIWIIDSNEKITFTNKKLNELFGYTNEEMIGRSIKSLMGEEYRYKFERDAEAKYRRKDGTELWVIVSSSRLYDHDGRFVGDLGMLTDITLRKQAENALKEREEQLRLIIENLHDAITKIDKNGKFEYLSPSIKNITGYAPDERMGKSAFELVHPDDLDRVIATYETSIKTSSSGKAEYRLRHADGHYIWLETTGNLLLDECGKFIGATMILRDITGRKLAEEKLRDAHQQLIDVIEFLPDQIFVIDKEKKIIAWNRAIEDATGISKEEVLGKEDNTFAIKVYGESRPLLIDFTFDNNPEIKSEYVSKYSYFKKIDNLLHAETYIPSLFNGKGAHIWITAAPLFDGEGNQVGAIETARDITERKQMEEKLKYLSMRDSLTGLYNRTYFDEEINRLKGGRQPPLGIIVCDVDGLKLINDTMGHEAGNTLLVSTANLIKSCFRSGDMIARIGGDEFVVLLPCTDRHAVESACHRIREIIADYNIANPELPLSLSIGFAISDNQTKSPNELFAEADLNMYREKLSHSQSTRSIIVKTLKKTLEVRDFATEGHAERMQKLVVHLATACGLPDYRLNDMSLFALFHDLGKIGIPDMILFKPGPLNEEEHLIINKHCEIGYNIANCVPDLIPIADWILKHHEWVNGCGYPLGLRGEEIPLECRILAIVDAYDAMTSDRPYRKAMNQDEAMAELIRCSGTQFDPRIVQKFVEISENQLL
ncbi:PAS domain S-box protein [Pelotomaculum sp. PtaB.Bin117]|uniref:PAS domain S-box protein n=1 Tax=Pelotomaculum sp. PtaB.Bin117 TaxID=1811694 RepID=UPI0009D4171D|nr:PAS domain S-box protein [Pelotomaculum sp. PtaB.Bin117]OPX90150.1 MAG: putative diguanylate cyclase YegE [Pelotomaculum sp. PtaB.Bin117]